MFSVGRLTRSWSQNWREPGTLYNLGNVIGFTCGVSVAVLSAQGAAGGVGERVWSYLLGNAAAFSMTLATIIFFWGGIVYSRAWANGAPPNMALNRAGDIYSGLGALCLGVGLVLLGDPVLAATAGALHALGKFGSALGGARSVRLFGHVVSVESLAKDVVLLSRIPAFLAALVGLSHDPLSISFLVCTMIWALADITLLSPNSLWSRLMPRLA